MPLIGTGSVAAEAIRVAEAAVKATWLAKNSVLSAAEQAQMRAEISTAGLNALFLHITANAVVVGSAAGVTSGPSAAVVAGTVT